LLIGATTGVALALASCGWAPLNANIEAGPAGEELRAIRVDPIPERLGQRLEMALRNSLNPSGEPARQRYVLRVTPAVGLSNLGVQAQGLATLGQLDVVGDLQFGRSGERQYYSYQYDTCREFLRSESQPIFDHRW
jgi:hypothetical protein